MKSITITPKRVFYASLYIGVVGGLIFGGIELYKQKHASKPSVVTAVLPNSNTPEEFLSNFYTLYNKDSSTRAQLLKKYTAADFQQKYQASKNIDLLLCGNKPTPTFSIEKAYKNQYKDNNIVYKLNLVYSAVGSQNTVLINVATQSYGYQIKDVLCTTEGGDLSKPPK